MIKFENTEVRGWEAAIRGMRNPMNSWEKSDSAWIDDTDNKFVVARSDFSDMVFWIGPNDQKLMMNLCYAGTDHRKFMRMIVIYVDITAPLYWWKEFDTYKVGTVANSCSTMHKIADKEFGMEDFSCEHLRAYTDNPEVVYGDGTDISITLDEECYYYYEPKDVLKDCIIPSLNLCRKKYLETKDKIYWWQMIQLLPSSYNQKRTVMMNYEVLANIYKSRKNHKLDEWNDFCAWIEDYLPFSELITGKENNKKNDYC